MTVMNKLVLSCLSNVISNRDRLCKIMPREVFGRETYDVLNSIIVESQTKTELSRQNISDLFILNTYIISKVGKYCQSKEYILN